MDHTKSLTSEESPV